MNREENRTFIGKSESLVKPRDIAAISFLGDFNRYLPKKTQQMIIEKGSATIPYMGFIVDPYALFLSYRITDTAAAQAMLPDGYELASTSLFRNEEKFPLVVISSFSVRTSAFMGMRLECYLIGRNRKTGRMAWIIADYETNTNSHDPKNGFCGYTGSPAVHTTTPYGELIAEVKGPDDNRVFTASADLNAGKMEELDEGLWIEGNLCVDYGGLLKDSSSSPFSLIFDPILMKEAWRIPAESFQTGSNTFLKGIIDPVRPQSVAVFPYSQHFVIRQDLQRKGEEITGKEDLLLQADIFLKKDGLKSMAGDDLKRPIFWGMVVSSLLNMGIMIFLVVKLLT